MLKYILFKHLSERRYILTRHSRKFSSTNVYHIIIKGIDGQDIFYDDNDRNIFLQNLLETKFNFFCKLYAYCLMSNHVHMVLSVTDDLLSKSIQSLTIKYAHYFNKKYKRLGPFVQNRFNSKVIENRKYFLEVCRYVHRNPENAGFAKTQNYEWSSYKEYISKANSKLVDKDTLLYYFNNSIDNFIQYTSYQEFSLNDKYNEFINFAEFELIDKLSDSDVIKIIMKYFNILNSADIPIFFKTKYKENDIKNLISTLKQIKGTNKSQISRIIRISRRQIEKYW